MRRSETVLVNLSGRGDKDMGILMELQEGGRESD
jgi:tryptophan synthase beta subunit